MNLQKNTTLKLGMIPQILGVKLYFCKDNLTQWNFFIFDQCNLLFSSIFLCAIVLLMGLALIVELLYSYIFQPNMKKPLFVKAVICFSPYTNIKGLAKTIDANAAGQIGCLNGIRYEIST